MVLTALHHTSVTPSGAIWNGTLKHSALTIAQQARKGQVASAVAQKAGEAYTPVEDVKSPPMKRDMIATL